jgi:O-antigen ligase
VLCASLFTVPLFNPENMFEGAFFGKEFGFYLLMTILLSYTVITTVFDHERSKVHFNMIDITFILFIIWNLISSTISGYPYITNKTYELFFLSFFYFIVKNIFSDSKICWNRLVLSTGILNIVVIIEVITGLLQLYKIIPSQNPYFILIGTFHNPAPYSLFLTVTFPYLFSVYLLDVFKVKYIKNLSLISCIAVLLVIPFTGNRASWIGIVLSLVFVLFFKYKHIAEKIKLTGLFKAVITSAAIILVFGAAFLLYNLKKGSSDGRLLIWKVSSNIIRDQPLTGVGYGRFRSVYNHYQADYFRGDHNIEEELLADNVRMAYNDYIETTVETGILGLILFLCFLYFIFSSLKFKNTLLIAFIAPIVVSSVLSLITYPLNTIPSKILFFFFAGVVSVESVRSGISTYNIKIRRLAAIPILLISLSISVRQTAKYFEYDEWLFAYKSLVNGQTEISEEYFGNIQDHLKYELRFSAFYAQCLYYNNKYDKVIEYLNGVKSKVPEPEIFLLLGNSYEKKSQTNEALKSYEEASYMVPGRILPKYYLAKLHYGEGMKEKADSVARIIMDMKIKVQSDTTFSLIKEIEELYNKNIQPDEYARQGH